MRGLAVIAALVLTLLTTAHAHAHATLVSSDPVDGAVSPAPPPRVVLTFNEPVSPLVMRLVAPDASVTVLTGTSARGPSLEVAMPADLRQGTHVLSWRVVSLDGHPVGGTVVFSIGAPTAAPAAASTSDAMISTSLWFCKIVLYVALFVGVGGSFFQSWMPGVPGVHPAISVTVVVGFVAVALAVGLQGADALGAPIAGLASRIVWQTGLGTSFGLTAVAAAFALFGGLFALHAGTRVAMRSLSLFGLVACGVALALSGHASAASPQWMTRPAVLAHGVMVAFWVGSLLPLAAALRGPDANVAALRAFSLAIPRAVAVLIASGVVLAVVQIGESSLLLSTNYGRLLCAKLMLIALLLGLAAWNRIRLTPRIIEGSDQARGQLRRTIAAELVIVVVIFGVVAAWRFTPPPRALALAAAKPAHVHIHTAQAMADVTFTPGRAGLADVEIVVMNAEFGSLDGKELKLTIENKAAGIEAITRHAAKGADAIWRVPQFPIPRDGRWEVQLDVLVTDFDKI